MCTGAHTHTHTHTHTHALTYTHRLRVKLYFKLGVPLLVKMHSLGYLKNEATKYLVHRVV